MGGKKEVVAETQNPDFLLKPHEVSDFPFGRTALIVGTYQLPSQNLRRSLVSKSEFKRASDSFDENGERELLSISNSQPFQKQNRRGLSSTPASF